jgi:beta-glucosidase
MKKTFLIIWACLMFIMSVNAQNETEQKVEDLLSKMTLEEKIGQMNQYSGFFDVTGPAPIFGENKNKYEHIKTGQVGSMLNVLGVKRIRKMQQLAVENSRLGIPLIFAYDVIHGYKTMAPIPLAEAASWDMQAIERSSRISAIEASAVGLNWAFAPMMDISRDARWGRVMEGGGEDPYLGSLVAQARVRGLQGNDLAAENTIAATAKHFAAYGFAEAGKEYNTVDIGVSTLYNMALPPFKAAVDAGVATVMNSFNETNGIPTTGNPHWQIDILKKQWNFDGFIVSDYATIVEMTIHGFAKDGVHAAEIAANAGTDMDMESHIYIKHLEDLVESGKVDEEKVNDAVRRILKVKFQLGLFDDPYKYCNEEREKEMVGHPDHMAAVLEMARKSIVLLKNDKNILPLAKSGKKIALIGPLAADKDSPLGSWRGQAEGNSAVSVKEGMAVYKGNEIAYTKGVNLFKGKPNFLNLVEVNSTDRTGMEEAIEAAKNAEVVVMVLGEHGFQSGEGRSRTNLDLPGLQQELLEAVYAVNPNIVLVLMNGRPLALTWAEENVPAIVEAWQLGHQSGHAIAQVLYGDYNPAGKLPVTFPRSVGQVPIYYNHKRTGRPNPQPIVFWSHYSDESNDPLYPFGYGLSYSEFKYDNLRLKVNEDRTVEVTVTVENLSNVAGEEVVQLYICDLYASVTRPVKELKGFEKIHLDGGESKTVSFRLTDKELGFFNNQGKFVVEPGDFDVMVGGNSRDTMKASFVLD